MAETSASSQRKKEETDFYFGRIIGEGSFSNVYLCKDAKTQKEYAIKVCNKMHIIREKKTEAIKMEKETMLKITSNWSSNSPFFVRLYATFHNSENLFFVLSYAKRGDMFKFIKKMAAKEVDVTQFYAAELVQAIEHLHQLKIIHRDLKPENILLNSNMHILVTDFGSAKIITDTNDLQEDAPKARRNSFVGTAQYVSPEILTNSGSSPASDLWAIGCILYQMVTVMPPFQSQSEYLIFQKIQTLDYSFHEGFDARAKDLVTKFLVIDPKERLGAQDTVGYPSIKSHPFFENIDFDNLHNSTPPQIQSYIGDPEKIDSIWEKYPSMQPGLGPTEMSRMLKIQIEDGSLEEESDQDDVDPADLDPDVASITSESTCLPASGNIGDLSDEERSRLLDLQRKNNEFHQFVEDKLILKQGILDKKKGLWSRRRMFLLTEGPRLFYVDPKEKILKGEIPWSSDMKTEMRNFRIFFVHTPNRIYYLIDPSSYASKWCEAIESVRNFYFPTAGQ
eukprot:GFUD01019514.1.p1 GENE.GFUD01019514.1~~GFUD01019514.1.p1  ORF type:complete len:507 (-),score=121.39 GFUD01019514.1:273-1793(-)